MLYVLVGDAEGDTETILSSGKRTNSLLWVVPKAAQIGVSALFYLPKYGFVARGKVASEPQREEAGRYTATVQGIKLLPNFVPVKFVREHHPEWKWSKYPRSYTIIDGLTESRLETVLKLRTTFIEGAAGKRLVTFYERNPQARRECIRKYGDSCFVCGFSFFGAYGEYAEGYIHVHHLEGIAGKGGKHSIDPIKELRPLCPNCHAVVHLRNPALSIAELKRIARPAGHSKG